MLFLLRSGFPKLTIKEHGLLLMTAVFEPGLYFIFETTGLQYTTASKASLIIATIPLTVILFSFLFLKERTRAGSIAGFALSFVGIGILVAGDPQFKLELKGSFLGDILIFGAVLSAAFYFIIVRNLGKTQAALGITFYQFFYGSLLYLPAFLIETRNFQWEGISTVSMGALIYLTFFATVGAYFCYNFALTRISASRTSVFINCIPVVTAIGAWALIGETLTIVQLCGGVLVLFSVIMTSFPFRKRPLKLEESPA
ncbi:EamA domain-containing protein [Desulfonema limicola]|uniref:EamA domain-containing protein n=2 Tax=Desulfonema limicola TaxID=45656 RepID=A0A975B9N5_9BACT|nr:EamA domain-containing protein [Desulfonema limicola]